MTFKHHPWSKARKKRYQASRDKGRLWHQCERKSKYLYKEDAERMLEVMRAPQELVGSYLCPFCRYWHIGHKVAEKQNA